MAQGGAGGDGGKGDEEKAETRRGDGGREGAYGQFVIKLKIPSAEEADERVNRRTPIETGRPRVAVT